MKRSVGTIRVRAAHRSSRLSLLLHIRWQTWVALIGAGLTLAGLHHTFYLLNTFLMSKLQMQPRYVQDFEAIVCPTPHGQDRCQFLAEVRYLSGHPPHFSILVPNTAERLRQAFAAHPWVADVREIRLTAYGSILVDLQFRQPQLQVLLSDGSICWVDQDGILLPAMLFSDQQVEHKPILKSVRPVPGCSAGQRWDDPVVLQALRLVKAYQPHQLHWTGDRWQLQLDDGRIVQVYGTP